MRKTSVLLFVFVAALAFGASLPENAEKALNKELKRHFPDSEITLFPLAFPASESANGYFYKINSNQPLTVNYAYVGRVIACRSTTCALPTKGNADTVDFLDYLVLYNAAFEVEKVKVFRLNSEHGVEVTSPGWLRQFTGYSPGKKLTVGKEVDAVSGATITVNNFTSDIQETTNLLYKIVYGITDWKNESKK